VRFEVKRGEDGFVAVPRVIIERYVRSEQPITASFYLRYAFRSQARQYSLGTPETDRGIYLPSSYWYATGRDEVLEGKIARAATKGLRRA
jgi:hypothetical protein